MATKIKLMKLMQEVRGYAQVTNRRPVPRSSVFYLMQMRERATQIETPRRRLRVETDRGDSSSTPLPIKINHINPHSAIPVVVR